MVDSPSPERARTAFDDADYPAYTMGRAADMLGVTPDFLRSLDAAGLLTPDRSTGGHRRYSRTELTLAARVRELLDSDLTILTAACRIAQLERDLTTTRQHLAALDTPPRHTRRA
ncbi:MULTISPECIES: helix-turn-helix domain-containing protein [Saccharopolyspora]|uniref:DNA-binding transcriptional MerR regulator n=1 Tax=Saccharopolyspora phatthalungensis TaxID=664693 RepID=A0A840QBZ2_9PSEU|nr:helix-turn-helix domain-containing protein [Saccharopolyspora phatthalungensis]MBB5158264.1 DNA-binding transcriptional MerR regulator [Saccharopolyspora phatthalungensis]